MNGRVVAVSLSPRHRFSKAPALSVRIVEGLGVEGDAHAGVTVRHRFKARFNPAAPNLRQVHLIQAELFEDLAAAGFDVGPGDLGENITTLGLDLLSLPTGTRLHIGPDVVVELTGLRTPCVLMDRFKPGLMAAALDRDDQGRVVRKAGVMAVAVGGGTVAAGDTVRVELPPHPHRPLKPV